jgi:two-component system, OmpR family, sensor histidine kinase ChvG
MTASPRLSIDSARPVSGDVLLGEDWERPDAETDASLRAARGRRGWFALNRSPLARKIIIFNLMALLVMVAGVMFMNPFRDSLVLQREQGMVTEAQLVANIMQARLVTTTGAEALKNLAIESGVDIFLFDATGALVAQDRGAGTLFHSDGAYLHSDGETLHSTEDHQRSTLITDFLNAIWDGVSSVLSGSDGSAQILDPQQLARNLFDRAAAGETVVSTSRGPEGGIIFSVATPVMRNGLVSGVVGLTSAEGELDRLVRAEREQVLQMFVIALLVSIGLSLVLASTIANPLSDLAAAAELGRDRDARKMAPGRVRIPDLTARPDEIGRLSVAMRGMVAALYDRIDANEQFAADVSHEIKNPLASLRSAVGTLRVAKRDDHRTKLLDVIDHDVRRLDRLVSDISNASRLDSELVKEEEESFNLLKTLSNLTEFLGKQANEKGVEFVTDLPDQPIMIRGLEGRLAQVFVNLITNATSFCEDGDAVRVWARKRDNRVLVVVEDTGPGIPEQALTKVFKRFYSERPVDDFGNHSGLGLAISKQIVEAHGGVIWAENIRPTNADMLSDPLGARFVVGLPV